VKRRGARTSRVRIAGRGLLERIAAVKIAPQKIEAERIAAVSVATTGAIVRIAAVRVAIAAASAERAVVVRAEGVPSRVLRRSSSRS